MIPDLRKLNLNGHVGLDLLAKQAVNKSLSDGFSFNILCIGETSIGKSTLIDTLFNTKFESKKNTHHENEVTLSTSTHYLQEENVNLKLNVTETVGFGDQINRENSFSVIADFIDDHFEANFQEELKLNRNFKQINDNLIHVCLYFITPTGHSIKSQDLYAMKLIDKKVSIVPLIAKSDIISRSEMVEFKKRILNELKQNGIKIYQFPTDELDESVNGRNEALNAIMPFAVVGSTELVKVGNNLTRGRQYEWGTVIVENETHCDFVKLREMLIRTNMFDLIEQAHDKHYQIYRSKRLKELGFTDDDDNGERSSTLFDVYYLKRTEMDSELQLKEMELKENFLYRVKVKEIELKEAEREIQERLISFKKLHLDKREKLEDKKRRLEGEMQEFRLRKLAMEQAKASGTLKQKKK